LQATRTAQYAVRPTVTPVLCQFPV